MNDRHHAGRESHMAICPNRTRKKRIGPGGGRVGCRGRLELILSVPLVLPVKGIPKVNTDSFRSMAHWQARTSGVRIKPDTLAKAYIAGRDIRCSECGWSLVKMERGVKR